MLKTAKNVTLINAKRLQGSGIKVFIYLGNTLLKQGKLRQASHYYQRALRSIINTGGTPEKSWPEGDCIEKGYLINDDYRFVYCPIPKVACSSLKKFMVNLSNLENKQEILNLSQRFFHSYISHTLSLPASQNYKDAIDILNGGSYFKFAFVRNPWERLTSAYLNKFVSPISHNQPNLPLAQHIIDDIYQTKNLDSTPKDSITFRQFVEYVSVTDDLHLDGHWKPQYLFLGKTKFDFIGRFETIEEDFAYIQKKLELSANLPWSNKSRSNVEESDVNEADLNRHYCDYFPKEISKLKKYPDYRKFYTPDLMEKIKTRYSQDIELFDYEF